MELFQRIGELITELSFMSCLCVIILVSGISGNFHYFHSPCRLSSETINELTIDTVNDSKGDVFCGIKCSVNEQCVAFSHKDNSCVLMSDPENYICSEDGTTYFKIDTQSTCTRTLSPSSNGNAFTMKDNYLIRETAISQIRVFLDNGDHLKGLEVTWQGGEVAMRGWSTGVVGICSLVPGEYVMKMEYAYVLWESVLHVVGPVIFVTTHQTCGLFGSVDTTAAVEGNKLLYFSGKTAGGFDVLDLVFKSC